MIFYVRRSHIAGIAGIGPASLLVGTIHEAAEAVGGVREQAALAADGHVLGAVLAACPRQPE